MASTAFGNLDVSRESVGEFYHDKANLMFTRGLHLPPAGRETFFLWGPRQTGKTTLLRQAYMRIIPRLDASWSVWNPSDGSLTMASRCGP